MERQYQAAESYEFTKYLEECMRGANSLGFAEGFRKGAVAGYAKCLLDTQSAVSEGLRMGSSECARNMRARRKSK